MPIRSSRSSRMTVGSRSGLSSRSGLRASSSILSQKDDVTGDIHFKWESIKKFLYIAFAYVSDTENFDIFSKILLEVRIFDYVILEVVVGMSYMCMDFFIRQYTQSLDLCGNLNPLLRGINLGAFLQTAMWTSLHAYHMTDILRYLGTSLQAAPSYSVCVKTAEVCVSARDVMMRCRLKNMFNRTYFNTTAAHFNYVNNFLTDDRSVITNRCFFLALVWLVNFFISSVSDDIIIKMLKISFIWRCVTISVNAITIAAFDARIQNEALGQILNISSPTTFWQSMDFISYTYSIGYIGLYDLGSMSPYTMVDNTVVIFTTVFTLFSFAKALSFRILYLSLNECVKTTFHGENKHYLIFAVAPLAAEFVKLQKLFNIHFYISLLIVTGTLVSMSTICMATILNTEFQTVKQIYLVGMLCFFGFFSSIPFALWPGLIFPGMRLGFSTVSLFLGALKVGTVMYIYGLNNFTTDIRFWLGYKPTKFWTINWFLLPIILTMFFFNKCKVFYPDDNDKGNKELLIAIGWTVFVFLTVLLLNIKTVIKFIMKNNVMGLLKPNRKYGPPDPDIRKRRRNYSETESLKTCAHGCMVLDENFDCSHAPETELISKLYVSSEVQLADDAIPVTDKNKNLVGKKSASKLPDTEQSNP